MTVTMRRNIELLASANPAAVGQQLANACHWAADLLSPGASPALLRGLMEGYKRALIIGPRLRWPVHDVARITRRIIVALTPPPEMHQPPPLWADEATLHRLADMPWPPVRDAAE